jgi:hypothetical protein
MVFCIIRENKRIIHKFDFGNNFDTSSYPLEDGSFILQKSIDDCCSICFENFNANDKVVPWVGCGHQYHLACYKELRFQHNILSCPTCRHKIEKVQYQKRYCFLFNDDNYWPKEKYNDVSCFYVDKEGNLNIRYKVFCKKYNFNIDNNDYNLFRFTNIPVPLLLNLVSLIYMEQTLEITKLLNMIFEKYVIYGDKKILQTRNIIIINNIKIISDLFNVDILSYLADIKKLAIDDLISSNKKTFSYSLKKFIFGTQGRLWFYTNSLNQRKKFYQDKLVKIVGEKYRKVFMQENMQDFLQNINLIK